MWTINITKFPSLFMRPFSYGLFLFGKKAYNTIRVKFGKTINV